MSGHQRPTHWACAIRPIGSGGRCAAGPQLHLPGSGARILVPKPAFCFEPAQGDSLGQQNTGHRAFMTSYRALPKWLSTIANESGGSSTRTFQSRCSERKLHGKLELPRIQHSPRCSEKSIRRGRNTKRRRGSYSGRRCKNRAHGLSSLSLE